MTTTFGHRYGSRSATARGSGTRTMPASLALLGILTILISAWGGIVAYVGPSFGYSADGASSWGWNLTHAVLALIPGAVGFLAGIVIWARSSNLSIGSGRISLAFAGFVALICGAWFVIGPFAWPVVDSTHAYFVPASPLHLLANLAGYSLGTGVILAACGGFALGWAVRHQRPSEAAAMPVQTVPRRRFARRALPEEAISPATATPPDATL